MTEETTHPIPLHGEEGYPWPCIKCDKVFTPRRLEKLPGSPMAKCCATCAWENLLAFVMSDDEP